MKCSEVQKSLRNFFKENYGDARPKLTDILRPRRLSVKGFSFAPEIFGNKLGSVDLDRTAGDVNFGGCGAVAGAGVGIAGACDLRLAARSATFVTAFDRIGASGDFGSSWFLSKIVGTAVARELFLLGETLSAEQALSKGIYTRLFDDEVLSPETLKVAHRLADGPRMAYRYMKQNLNNAEDWSFEAQFDAEALNMGLSTQASAQIRHEQERGGSGG